MARFGTFLLGLLIGWASSFSLMLLFSIPTMIGVGGKEEQEAMMYLIMWAFFAGPLFGLSFTSSKGYFGGVSLFFFIFFTSLNVILGIVQAFNMLNDSYGTYSLCIIVSFSILPFSAILFLYWYICIGSGECSFIRIWLIPMGIVALTIGVFALLRLAGKGLCLALSLIIAVACIIAVIVIFKKNGSITYGR